jgi:hypothetical protein
LKNPAANRRPAPLRPTGGCRNAWTFVAKPRRRPLIIGQQQPEFAGREVARFYMESTKGIEFAPVSFQIRGGDNRFTANAFLDYGPTRNQTCWHLCL